MRILSLPLRPRILVIRRDNIGDLVCTTPAIASLREHYPDAEIAALVNSYNAEVLKSNPHLDYVFVYQKLKHAGDIIGRIKAISDRLKLIFRLRCWRPDLTILAKASYDRHGCNFARLIGAKNIIGYVPGGHSLLNGLLPDIQMPTPEFAALHEVEAVNQLLVPLGISDALGPMQVFPDAKAMEDLCATIPTAALRIALHISAREPERRWGGDNFIALAKHILTTETAIQILLFWSPGGVDDPCHPGDDNAAVQLIKKIASDRLIPMPTQNLTELIAGISFCDLFIGADGGALHLAVGLNKPCLALFENALQKVNHWYPWRVNYRLVYSHDACDPNVRSVTIDQVLSETYSLLRSISKRY